MHAAGVERYREAWEIAYLINGESEGLAAFPYPNSFALEREPCASSSSSVLCAPICSEAVRQ